MSTTPFTSKMMAIDTNLELGPGLKFRAFAGFIVLILFVAVFQQQRSKSQRLALLGGKAKEVPYKLPFGLDIFAQAIKGLINHTFFQWTRKLLNVPGRTVNLNFLGVPVVMTDNTENLKAVLSTKFSDFGKGEAFHKIWYDLMFDSIFATDGAMWHANKDLLREHTTKVRQSDFPVFEKHTQIVLGNFANGNIHECLDQMDRFILDVVSDVFFGESTGTLSTELQPLRDAVEEMYVWNTQRILVGRIGALLPGTAKASKVLQRYLDGTIEKFMSSDHDDQSDEGRRRERCMIGSLLNSGQSIKRVKDSMMAILIGGKDPGSVTLVWAYYELARNPDLVRQLRAEIEKVVGLDNIPTAAQLKSITLLQNIIKETLRLHVPLGFNIRTALRDTTLPRGAGSDGSQPVGVLKGTHVLMSYIGAHRSQERMGASADTFDPHRWYAWKPETWEFMPFNHGPRICLGRNFAQTVMEYLICRTFQKYSGVTIVGADGEPDTRGGEMNIKIALNTKPAEPVMLRFEA